MEARDDFIASLSNVSDSRWWSAPVLDEVHDHAYENVIEEQITVPDSNDPSREAIQNAYYYEGCGCLASQPEPNHEFYADLDY